MNTKLTLTIEHSVIKRAKNYAKANRQSLSDIIENYLKAITDDELEANIEIAPIVKSLKGSFTAPKDFDYKQELTIGLSEKYL